MVGIPTGRLGAGGLLISTWINPDGTPGKLLEAGDLDGSYVKTITQAGGTLTAVLQLADNTEGMVEFSPAAAAGGLSDYTGFAGYVAATQRMTLTVIGAPALGQGVGVYAGTPANLDNSGSNLTIVYDGVDYEVYDVTLRRVRPADLSASQVYEFRRFNVSSNPALVIMRPLSLDQIVPVQTVTVPVTNAQLKTLDDTYIEVIPAPGAGRFIEIVRIRFNVSGSDELRTDFPLLTPEDQGVRNMLNSIRYSLLYVLDDSNGYPLFAYGGEFTTAYSERYTNLINQNGSLIFSVGDQQLQENKALVFGFYLLLSDVFRTLMGQNAPYYSAASYDYFWSGVDDKAIEIVVDYYIRD